MGSPLPLVLRDPPRSRSLERNRGRTTDGFAKLSDLTGFMNRLDAKLDSKFALFETQLAGFRADIVPELQAKLDDQERRHEAELELSRKLHEKLHESPQHHHRRAGTHASCRNSQ